MQVLIAERIDSIPELEALLLLRQHSEHEWTADEAGKRLYVSTTVAAHILSGLAERGFFEKTDNGYRYRPESEALADTISALAAAYSRHLVMVAELVHSTSRGARDFANAFRFRKPK